MSYSIKLIDKLVAKVAKPACHSREGGNPVYSNGLNPCLQRNDRILATDSDRLQFMTGSVNFGMGQRLWMWFSTLFMSAEKAIEHMALVPRSRSAELVDLIKSRCGKDLSKIWVIFIARLVAGNFKMATIERINSTYPSLSQQRIAELHKETRDKLLKKIDENCPDGGPSQRKIKAKKRFTQTRSTTYHYSLDGAAYDFSVRTGPIWEIPALAVATFFASLLAAVSVLDNAAGVGGDELIILPIAAIAWDKYLQAWGL